MSTPEEDINNNAQLLALKSAEECKIIEPSIEVHSINITPMGRG